MWRGPFLASRMNEATQLCVGKGRFSHLKVSHIEQLAISVAEAKLWSELLSQVQAERIS